MEQQIPLIFTRRSCRRFSTEKIPETTLNLLIRAGQAAPSAHNSTPWYFKILSPEDVTSISERICESALNQRIVQGRIAEKIGLLTRHSARIMIEAATVIAAFNTESLKGSFLNGNDAALERYLDLMEAQSVAAGIQNILLSAHALGLGAVWLGTPIFFDEVLTDVLNTPYKPMGLIAIGYHLFTEASEGRGNTQ